MSWIVLPLDGGGVAAFGADERRLRFLLSRAKKALRPYSPKGTPIYEGYFAPWCRTCDAPPVTDGYRIDKDEPEWTDGYLTVAQIDVGGARFVSLDACTLRTGALKRQDLQNILSKLCTRTSSTSETSPPN